MSDEQYRWVKVDIKPPELEAKEDLLSAIDKSPELKALIAKAAFAHRNNDFARANYLIDEAMKLWKELKDKER